MKKVWYFGLEPLKERYTGQLSMYWMPRAFSNQDVEFVQVEGTLQTGGEIKVGAVLDAVGRGQYCLTQCFSFLEKIREGLVKEGDIIYLQDYWTGGIETIFYALDLYGYKDIKVYARCWAQSVDEYDFTFWMRDWMRMYELGLDKKLSGIFVGSTEHRDLLRSAGFTAPIHVLSLPYNIEEVETNYGLDDVQKEKQVVYTSRFDKEKNPYFLLAVAKEFLARNKDYSFVVTTSAGKIRSNIASVEKDFLDYAAIEPRFKILTNLTKQQYYTQLQQSVVQLNTALQDWVSFTSIEADTFGCKLVYPNFRGFKEMYFIDGFYTPFDVDSAVNAITDNLTPKTEYGNLAKLSHVGTLMEAHIICNNVKQEVNIWHEYEYIKKLLSL